MVATTRENISPSLVLELLKRIGGIIKVRVRTTLVGQQHRLLAIVWLQLQYSQRLSGLAGLLRAAERRGCAKEFCAAL